MLEQETATVREYDTLSPESFVAFFEPPSLDERIVNQFTLFSLLSHPQLTLVEWLVSRPSTGLRLIIPALLKWKSRGHLDKANVAEHILFPEWDGLCRWLTRYSMPRA